MNNVQRQPIPAEWRAPAGAGRRARKWLPAVLATWVAVGPVHADPSIGRRGNPPPSQVGEWSLPILWPVEAIHAFTLPSGKVLHFSFPGSMLEPNAFLWDPTTASFTPVPVNRPLFCSGHSFMADGRLLITGGNAPGAPPGEFWGIRDTHIFDPFNETWTRVEDMAAGRWYPTNVTLADGRVLVFSGLDETGGYNTDVEIYVPGSTLGWQIVTDQWLPLYPRMYLLSSGDLFYSGPTQETGIFSTSSWSWYGIVWSNFGDRYDSLSVPLPPGGDKVMVIGGHDGLVVTETAEIIDLSAPSPSWRYTQPMSFPRMHANAVILPDGRILVVGGHSDMHSDRGGRGGGGSTPVYEAEMFDPATETWSLMAAMQRPRMYHSTAVLLPGGRVLAAGGDGEFTAEIFSPPYLFKGPRPVIVSTVTRLPYGSPFPIGSPNATQIQSIALIRLSSVTHSVNMDQRYVSLQFTPPGQFSATLTAIAPAGSTLAPPGYYMLFILNADGVPSEATMVRLGTSLGDVNGDDVVDIGDLDPFVAVLLGADTAPDSVVAADMDSSGVADGDDIQPFVDRLLLPY